MLTIYKCIVENHDLRLVTLAAMLCSLASFTAISLLYHVRKSSGSLRDVWLAVASLTIGFGIWATHFIAMLAFSPALPHRYNLPLTALSLVAALSLTGIGLAVASSGTAARNAWIGGAIVGAGIVTMHFIGMAAVESEARAEWNVPLVVTSIAIAGLLGAAAMRTSLYLDTRKWRFIGALLLSAAICGHHFTAMAALTIIPDPTVAVSQLAMTPSWLAAAVAVASCTILVLACAGLSLDNLEQRRTKLEAERMRGLANAAVEGLVLCHSDVIATVNESFANLVNSSVNAVIGLKLDHFFSNAAACLNASQEIDQAIETELRLSNGTLIPVELLRRPIYFEGKPHSAIAVRDLRARKQAEQRIRFLVQHDALTGLPNRPTFNKTIDREIDDALKSGRQLALLCLDLDLFKEVNELFGQAAGDRVLQIVAASVTGILDQSQMMARFGGDEFAIILPGITSPSIAGRVADRVLAVLRAESNRANPATHISTSIGIAICPRDASDRQSLLNHADTALYCAKREGRGSYRFFAPSMGADIRDRRSLEHDMRHAISRHELRLVYQPQQDLQSNTIIGFEALLRWNHPTRGEIPPDSFIPIAEESGAIIDIGDWVLRAACQEAAGWRDDLTVAVNVSTVQLHADNFADRLHAVLLETKLPAHRLEIEITETSLVRDLDRALAALRQIKMLGIRIVMDDFGTGYSSLSNLRAFPFDKIKLDRSFIKSVDTNIQSATIVRAMLGLGRGLGLPVLAEGVETPGELQFLKDEHCDEFQGYLLSRPAAIEQFRHLTQRAAAANEPGVALAVEAAKRLRVVRP
jgi:diguanylate cyclase (GGDEF)-like protein